MKGWSPNVEMSPPDTAPRTTPAPSTAATAPGAPHPIWMVTRLKRTAARARTLPTARSIPAVTMTSVMPQARIPCTEAWRSIAWCVSQR